VTVNGEIASPPEIDAGLAAAALAVFAHRHEVIHLLYAATDEADALARIAGLLRVPEATIARVLDQPFRWMLPQLRAELESIATATPPPAAPPTPPAEVFESLAAPTISAAAMNAAATPSGAPPARPVSTPGVQPGAPEAPVPPATNGLDALTRPAIPSTNPLDAPVGAPAAH
jgi:hypothetical protein